MRLLGKGYLQKDIAEVLGFHKSSISREIRRIHTRDEYSALHAENHAYVRRLRSKYQGMKIQNDTVLKERIVSALQEYQSPEAISGRYKDISHVSIYKWLYSSWGQQYCSLLCGKRHCKKRMKTNKSTREMIQNAVSIHERPKSGIHFEGDLFVSPTKLPHSVSGAMFVEPQSQYMRAVRIPNRKPSTMVKVVNRLVQELNIDDITWDRGIENKYHEQFDTKSYFCDPRSPWQKPHVENNIGLLRKWFVPKGTDLGCMSQKQLDRYVYILNHKWRKSLNYRSAHEVAQEFGII